MLTLDRNARRQSKTVEAAKFNKLADDIIVNKKLISLQLDELHTRRTNLYFLIKKKYSLL